MAEQDKIDLQALAQEIKELPLEEKRAMLLRLQRLRKPGKTGSKRSTSKRRAPTTDDELWEWIKEETGIRIPRVAVCPDHCAPFDFTADFYFERERSLLLMASREGGKTIGVAVVHVVNAETKDGCESVTFGAIEDQAKRAYHHVQGFVKEPDGEGGKRLKPQIEESIRSETRWHTGSKIEILTGCLPGWEQVITERGPMPIEKVVAHQLPVRVKSYSFKRRRWEWRSVTDWHDNGYTSTWIRAECDGGQILCATPGHEILTPSGYKVELVDMRVGDEVCILLPRQEHDRNGLCTARITSLDVVEDLDRRFDLTVAENENYCTVTGVLVGNTRNAVNSPHPQKVHADEVDLMEAEVWLESRNMSSSKKLVDGDGNVTGVIKAQDVATSTRKSARGQMQQLIDEIEAARKQGFKPAWKLYVYCCFEAAEEVPNCRRAPTEEREARLTELGMDPCSLCDCDKVRSGEWREGIPRTLDTVCRGKFFRSRGWMLHEDVVGKFQQNTQATWEAQQECRRPSAEGLYLPTFSRERHALRGWDPRPEFGSIWTGTDWGGGAQSCVLWIQGPTHVPVEVAAYDGAERLVVPEDSYVIFDMLYLAGVGATKLADMAVAKEIGWKRLHPGWKVKARFADMAGRQQRDDWREHHPPLRTVWYISRDFEPTVLTVQTLVEDGHWFVDCDRCMEVVDEAEAWRKKNGKEVKEFNHAMAANRYALANVDVLERRKRKHAGGKQLQPVVEGRRGPTDPTGAASFGAIASTGTSFESERWRETLGQPPIRPPTR